MTLNEMDMTRNGSTRLSCRAMRAAWHVVAGALLFSGCSKVCTLAGCIDGLEIVLSATGHVGASPLPAGEYVISVTLDGVANTTTCAIGSTPLRCSGATSTLSVGSGGSNIFVDISSDPIKSATITVTRDGVELVSRDFKPNYHAFSPNGPECEPTCMEASENIALSL